MSDQLPARLDRILSCVSRSFYLTLKVLPSAIRPQIGLAYLLARAADTIADTSALAVEQRQLALSQLQQQVQQPATLLNWSSILDSISHNISPAEQQLLKDLPTLFELLSQYEAIDRQPIQQVVMQLSQGMAFDLAYFPAEQSGQIATLQHFNDLDFYTYQVAGCVGEFWTSMSCQHIKALQHWAPQHYNELGIRFGKGLQLTNILRDLPRDLRIARCYLPQSWLDQHQLTTCQLLQKQNSQLARPLLLQGVQQTLAHFSAAQNYILDIPQHCIRLRLAALWPLVIGLATLEQLVVNSHFWLDPDQVIKVKRKWLYKMMGYSMLCVCSNQLTTRWLADYFRRVQQACDQLPLG